MRAYTVMSYRSSKGIFLFTECRQGEEGDPFFILQENIMGIPRYLSNKIENEISQIDYFKKKVIV